MSSELINSFLPLLRDGVDIGGAGSNVVVVVVEGAGEARGRVVQTLLVDLLKIRNKTKDFRKYSVFNLGSPLPMYIQEKPLIG